MEKSLLILFCIIIFLVSAVCFVVWICSLVSEIRFRKYAKEKWAVCDSSIRNHELVHEVRRFVVDWNGRVIKVNSDPFRETKNFLREGDEVKVLAYERKFFGFPDVTVRVIDSRYSKSVSGKRYIHFVLLFFAIVFLCIGIFLYTLL